MKRWLLATIAAFLMAGVAVAAGPARETQKRGKPQRAVARDVERTSVDVNVIFSTRDVRVIREYYAPKHKKLPPGLQKKYARTGTLPPGWQKKMQPFPIELERDLVVLPAGYRRGLIDGHAVIYQPGTHVIIDVALIF